MNRECVIEEAIMNQPERIGFPGAMAIRNCRLALHAGRVDVALLPAGGPIKLALIEAKISTAGDAASKVIGQLLMYYSGALLLGSEGLRRMREFAAKDPVRAQSRSTVSPKRLTDGLSPPDRAWKVLYGGESLLPQEIKLFVALDNPAHRALVPTLSTLRMHHYLDIGVILVNGTRIERVH